MKKYHLVIYISAILLLLFNGCKKDNDEENSQWNAESFYPNSGKARTLVTIQGTGFSTDYSAYQVSIGGVAAEVLSLTSERMIVRVPDNGATGEVVVRSSSTSQNLGTFTYQDLSILSVSSQKNIAYTIIELKGYGFKGDASIPKVTVNDTIDFKIVAYSDTVLRVAVPEKGMGEGPLVVSVGEKKVMGPVFSFVKLLDYYPKKGRAGTEITFVGSGFSTKTGGTKIIYANSAREEDSYVTLELLKISKDTIIARLPEGITESGLIYMETEGIEGRFTMVNNTWFSYVKPVTVTRLSASEGYVGDDLYIYGTSFNAGTLEVFIGDKLLSANHINWNSAGTISIKIPDPADGYSSGIIKVVVDGEEALGPYFEIKVKEPEVPGITSIEYYPDPSGNYFVVNGFSLEPDQGKPQVFIGSKEISAANITAFSDKFIEILLPDDIQEGMVKVIVNETTYEGSYFNRADYE